MCLVWSSPSDWLLAGAQFFFLCWIWLSGLKRSWGDPGWKFFWVWGLPARLLEEVKSGSVLPLRALHTDPMFRHPGTLDVPVCGPHQSDGNRTLNVSIHPRVGLLTLGCEADGYPFQGISCLHPQ